MIKSQNFDHYKFGVHFQWKYVICNLQFVRQGSQNKSFKKKDCLAAPRTIERHAKLLKGNRFYSLWMLVYKRTGDISPVSHMNKHKCIMNVHYLAIATIITFPGARRENSLSQKVQTQEWENTLQWVPLEAEYNNNNKKRKQSIQMTNVIFGMQTLYKYIIIGFQHWLAKRRT